jgi:RNA-directed DNA polymerase
VPYLEPDLAAELAPALLRANGRPVTDAAVLAMAAVLEFVEFTPAWKLKRSLVSRPKRPSSIAVPPSVSTTPDEAALCQREAQTGAQPSLPMRDVKRSPGTLLDDLVGGRITAKDVGAEERRDLCRYCRDACKASAAAIQRLVDVGHRKHAKRERREHIRRREVLLHALLCAARKNWSVTEAMTVDEREAQRQRQLQMAVTHLGVVGRFGRSARAEQRLKPKKDGGHRPIMKFYWVDYARQIVLKSALTPFANLHDGQAMLARDPNRRGPATVRETLLAKLNECGESDVFMQFDVRDFYGSISHEWLEGHLGIDPALIRKHVHTGGMLIETIGEMTDVRDDHEASRSTKTGRRGIPQGSAVSPLIAEQVMASVIGSVAALEELGPITWSDNLAVIVPGDRVAAIDSLVHAAFADHGAGPFHLTVCRTPVTREFRFLGAWFRKTPSGAVAYIPEAVSINWEAKVSGALQHAHTVRQLDGLERGVRGKLAQWSWCESAAERGRYLLGLIAKMREHIQSA